MHSSVYAKAQHANGSETQHSSMAYSERKKIEQNRTLVKGYEHSMVSKGGNKRPSMAITDTPDSNTGPVPQPQAQSEYGRVPMKQYIQNSWGFGQNTGTRGDISGGNLRFHTGYGRNASTTADAPVSSNARTEAIQQRQTRAERFNSVSKRPSSASITTPRPTFGRH